MRVGKHEMRKILASDFYQRDVQIFVDVNNRAFELLVVRKQNEQ